MIAAGRRRLGFRADAIPLPILVGGGGGTHRVLPAGSNGGSRRSPRWSHQGINRCQPRAREAARRTLVVATCDPAANFLALEYSRQTPFRMIVLRRSSREAWS